MILFCRFGNQPVHDLQGSFVQDGFRSVAQRCADDGWRGDVTTIDRDHRYAVNLVCALQLGCALYFGLDAEGVVGFSEFLRVYALLGDEVSDLLVGIQRLTLYVDGAEYFAVQGVNPAECFQRVVELLLRDEGVAEGNRYALEVDFVALLFHPCFERWFERAAMRAGVPEEFGDFDFFAAVDLLGFFQRTVIGAIDRSGWRSASGRGKQTQTCDSQQV